MIKEKRDLRKKKSMNGKQTKEWPCAERSKTEKERESICETKYHEEVLYSSVGRMCCDCNIAKVGS